MSTAPDPKTVREIAREFLLDDDLTADDLGYAVRRHTGYGMPAEEFQAWRNAVDADVEEATVTKVASWPDEQQPEFECEVCTKPITAYPCVLCEHEPDPWKRPDEQQPADVVTAEIKCGRDCSKMHTYEPGLCEAAVTAEQQQDGAVGREAVETVRAWVDGARFDEELIELEAQTLRAALADYDALAARVAELESEREADTWDVRGLLMALIVLGSRWPAGLERRANRLRSRFADRIAALDADTDGGAE